MNTYVTIHPTSGKPARFVVCLVENGQVTWSSERSYGRYDSASGRVWAEAKARNVPIRLELPPPGKEAA